MSCRNRKNETCGGFQLNKQHINYEETNKRNGKTYKEALGDEREVVREFLSV